MSSLVPDEFKFLEELSIAEIERRVQALRNADHKALTEAQLTEAVALHTIARRKTAGPPKAKPGKTKEVDLATLAGDLGI